MAQTVGNTVAQVETPLVRRSSLVALISVAGLGIVSSPANGSVRAGDDSPESRYCWIAQSLGGQRAGGRSCYAGMVDFHEC